MKTKVEVIGMPALQVRLLKAGPRSLRGAFEQIGGNMKLTVKRTFQAQADPVTGRPWPRLAPLTKSIRPKQTGTVLQDTTRLLRSINAYPTKITASSAQIGTALEYARIHQLGGVIKPKNGKYLWLPSSREAKLAGTVERFMKKKKAQGFRFFILKRRGKVTCCYVAAAKKQTKTGKTKKNRVMVAYILKKSVVLARRRYFGWGDAQKRFVMLSLKEAMGFLPPSGRPKA